MTPSYSEISPSMDNKTSRNEMPIIIGISLRRMGLFTATGIITADMAITIPMFAILLPMTFPRIIALCWLRAAATLDASSAVEVP